MTGALIAGAVALLAFGAMMAAMRPMKACQCDICRYRRNRNR